MKNQIPIELKSVTSSMADRCSAMRLLLMACVALLHVALAAATAQGQMLLTQTTWGGVGSDVAVSADGSVYVTGITANNGNDAVLLKFDASGTLLWERIWGGAASDAGLAVATAADGSVYITRTATSFGPSSNGLFVVKFDSAGNLVWQRISDGAEGNAVAVASDGSVYAAGTTPRPNQIGNFDIVAL